LKILKQELEHIIKKLTDWKNFVFADPLLLRGTISRPTHKTREMQNSKPIIKPNFALHLFFPDAHNLTRKII